MSKVSTVKEKGLNRVDAKSPQLLLPDAASTAEIVVSQAMEYCARKMGLSESAQAVQRLKEGNRTACSYCQYSVAKQLGESLGALDENIKAIYLFECDATPEDAFLSEAPGMPTIHLLVWASRRTSALTSMLEGLDRAMGQICAGMLDKGEAAHILDAQVITDSDVENHTGYGALLVSLFNRPLKLWER